MAYHMPLCKRCHIGNEIEKQERLIKNLLAKMKHLPLISIELYLRRFEFVGDCEKLLLRKQSTFTALEHMTSCKVYHYDLSANEWNYDQEKQLVMKVGKGTNSLQRVDKIEPENGGEVTAPASEDGN